MAHTVETLSKLLKKSPEQVISILTAAGISGKTADSSISSEERQILMSSLSKRSATKSSISVSRKTTTPASSSSTGGVKIQVKKKREMPQTNQSEDIDNADVIKAKEALEAGRIAEQKDEERDAKRNDIVRQQKIKNEELKAQKNQKDIRKICHSLLYVSSSGNQVDDLPLALNKDAVSASWPRSGRACEHKKGFFF